LISRYYHFRFYPFVFLFKDPLGPWWKQNLIMNKVFFIENFQFSLLVLYWTKNLSKTFALWRSHQSMFLKQDFNGSRSSWLDSWLSWVCFNLIVGSREIDLTGSHQICSMWRCQNLKDCKFCIVKFTKINCDITQRKSWLVCSNYY
jgi:hypothetical protein